MVRGVNSRTVVRSRAGAGARARRDDQTPTPLKGRFLLFFALLLWAYCIGQAYDSSEWVIDLTELKNNLFYMLLFFLFYAAVSDVKTVRILIATLLFISFYAVYLGTRQALDYGIGSYNETRRVAAPFSWSYWDAEPLGDLLLRHAAAVRRRRAVLQVEAAATTVSLGSCCSASSPSSSRIRGRPTSSSRRWPCC